MTDLATAMDAARGAAKGPGQGMVAAMMERLGATARVEAVFGAPVERDGVTIVPVARVSWAGGGGGGSGNADKEGKHETGEGGGGGGRVTAKPAGFIRIRGGDAEFVRIPDPAAVVPLFIAAGVVAWLLLRAMRPLLK